MPGKSTAALGEVARETGTLIIASLFERRSAGLYHNTAAIIDADGKLLGKYRKMHIPDDPLYHEKFYFAPGDLGFQGVGHCARQDRRLRLLGPMVSGSRATDRIARRRDYFLSNGNRLASEREKGIWKSATFRVGDDSAWSCNRQWVLRRGGEPRRSRSARRWRWHRILGAKFRVRTGRRNHRERFDRSRRDCDGGDRLGSRQRAADALAILARSQNRCLRRH